MSLITAQNIVRVYGHGSSQFKALRGVSLGIQKAESVAIVGKSGSGKSTLMHILALLDHPTSGTISLNDQPVQSIKTKAQNQIRNQMFGFVFQQFFLNARDSVLENVMLPLRIGGIIGSKRRYLAEAAIEAVGLSDKQNNHAQDLSGGQKQRVCIARALVNNPEIIFADEPTGNLDSTTSAKIENILFDLQKKQDITLIMVTHDQDLAAKCRRQIQIKDGQIVSEKGAHQ